MERMDAAKPLLEVRHLNIAFASGKKLTRRTEDVHFQIRPGEILSIVGESGCGKSITALSLLRLLNRRDVWKAVKCFSKVATCSP